LYKKIQDLIKQLDNVNLFSLMPGIQDKFLPFNLNVQNLMFLLKLVYGDQLLVLYENIFALCKLSNFTPEYIENCTPGEYTFFVKKLEALNNSKTSNNLVDPAMDNPTFNDFDIPPITGLSEFTP